MTLDPLLVAAGGLLAAGTGAVILALASGGRDDAPTEPEPVRQAAEHSSLIPRPGGTT